MITGISDDTDSVLFVNPKLLKSQTKGSLTNLHDLDECVPLSPGSRINQNESISCIIAMLHGVEVLCNLPVLYIYKDDFKLHPATLMLVLGLIRIPMNIKLLFALLSDGVPLFGSRRRSYLAIGAFLCFLTNFLLGFIGHRSLVVTSILLALCSLGMAICSVIGEALIIESGRKQSNDQVTRTVSTFCAFRKLTFAAMSYLSSILIMIIPKHKIFLISSIIPLIVLFSALFIQERDLTAHLGLKERWNRLTTFVSRSEIKKTIIFLFITMLVPSAGTALFYFMAEVLHFEPELFGRFAVFQAIAGLIGIYCYTILFRHTSIRKLFIWTTVLASGLCSLSIVLVKRWNLSIGIPDTAFVITDSSLLQFVGDINSLPIFIMITRSCPKGIESSMYSLLWTAQFLGMDISTYLSSLLTFSFGIDSTHFGGLVWFIILCAIAHLVPILFVGTLPEYLPNKIDNVTDTTPCLSDGEKEGEALGYQGAEQNNN